MGSDSEFLEYLKACVSKAERDEVLSFLLSQGSSDAETGRPEAEAREIAQRLEDRVRTYREVRDFKAKLFLWRLKKKSGN